MTSREKDRKKSLVETNITCDLESCPVNTPKRMEVLQNNRSLLDKADLSIFTSGIRIAIALILLKMESACVCEIQYILNKPSQPLISHHLPMMKDAGWLQSEKWKK